MQIRNNTILVIFLSIFMIFSIGFTAYKTLVKQDYEILKI